jgi:arabinogalactan oligomer/maltooligosaccharide transport system permease protein
VKGASGAKLFLIHGALALASAATLYPVLWVLRMALSGEQTFVLDPSPLPTRVSVANFAAVVATSAALWWGGAAEDAPPPDLDAAA